MPPSILRLILIIQLCHSIHYPVDGTIDTIVPSPMSVHVSTPQGDVIGIVSESDGLVTFFRGIPFAFPPIGTRRFTSPILMEQFPTDAPVPFPANETRLPCMQPTSDSTVIGSEDCLYLNVIRPTNIPPNSKLPVLVYIHGGGFVAGGVMISPLENFVRANLSLITVAISYRLSVFGFLAHHALSFEKGVGNLASSGNFGFEDQVTALKWVQANIGAYGGDPQQVTIMGESSGAISICLHLVSSISVNLFHRAILESGGCDIEPNSLYEAENRGEEWANETALIPGFQACSGFAGIAATLACFRDDKLTGEMIIGITNIIHGFDYFLIGRPFRPVVDGIIWTDFPRNLFEAKLAMDIPLLIGSNLKEMSIFLYPLQSLSQFPHASPRIVREWAQMKGNNDTTIENYYTTGVANGRFYDQFDAFGSLLSAYLFQCPIRRLTSSISSFASSTGPSTSSNVYAYIFNYSSPTASYYTDMTHGAFHGLELPFVFGLPSLVNSSVVYPPADVELTTDGVWEHEEDERVNLIMRMMWVNFIMTGVPTANGASFTGLKYQNGTRFLPPDIDWPSYDSDSDNSLFINFQGSQDIGVIRNLYDDQCSLWDAAFRNLSSASFEPYTVVPEYQHLRPFTSTPTFKMAMILIGVIWLCIPMLVHWGILVTTKILSLHKRPPYSNINGMINEGVSDLVHDQSLPQVKSDFKSTNRHHRHSSIHLYQKVQAEKLVYAFHRLSYWPEVVEATGEWRVSDASSRSGEIQPCLEDDFLVQSTLNHINSPMSKTVTFAGGMNPSPTPSPIRDQTINSHGGSTRVTNEPQIILGCMLDGHSLTHSVASSTANSPKHMALPIHAVDSLRTNHTTTSMIELQPITPRNGDVFGPAATRVMNAVSASRPSVDAPIEFNDTSSTNCNSRLPQSALNSLSTCLLKSVSGSFSTGELIGIMGTSGSGKTTLLELLTLRRQTGMISGDILINGQNVTTCLPWLSESMGFVSQFGSPALPELSIRENLIYAALLRLDADLSLEHKIRRVDEVLGMSGLEGVQHVRVGSEGQLGGISGGQKRRVAVALELLAKPRFLFLDEPTSGLDAASALELLLVLYNYAREGNCVLMSIHQPRKEIWNLFSQVMIVDRGRIVFQGPPAKAITDILISIHHANVTPSVRTTLDRSVKNILRGEMNVADFVLDVLRYTDVGDSLYKRYLEVIQPELIRQIMDQVYQHQRAITNQKSLPQTSSMYESIPIHLRLQEVWSTRQVELNRPYRVLQRWSIRLFALESRRMLALPYSMILKMPVFFLVLGLFLSTTFFREIHFAISVAGWFTVLTNCGIQLALTHITAIMYYAIPTYEKEVMVGCVTPAQHNLSIYLHVNGTILIASLLCWIPGLCITAVPRALTLAEILLEVLVLCLCFNTFTLFYLAIVSMMKNMWSLDNTASINSVGLTFSGVFTGFMILIQDIPVGAQFLLYMNPLYWTFGGLMKLRIGAMLKFLPEQVDDLLTLQVVSIYKLQYVDIYGHMLILFLMQLLYGVLSWLMLAAPWSHHQPVRMQFNRAAMKQVQAHSIQIERERRHAQHDQQRAVERILSELKEAMEDQNNLIVLDRQLSNKENDVTTDISNPISPPSIPNEIKSTVNHNTDPIEINTTTMDSLVSPPHLSEPPITIPSKSRPSKSRLQSHLSYSGTINLTVNIEDDPADDIRILESDQNPITSPIFHIELETAEGKH